jgi:hypothetical protein
MCYRIAIRAIYSVAAIVVDSEQQGLLQSAGRSVLGQLPFSAQQALVPSTGQGFATEPQSAVCEQSALATSAEQAVTAGHPAAAFAGHILACEPVSDLADRIFV